MLPSFQLAALSMLRSSQYDDYLENLQQNDTKAKDVKDAEMLKEEKKDEEEWKSRGS